MNIIQVNLGLQSEHVQDTNDITMSDLLVLLVFNNVSMPSSHDLGIQESLS